ncbi:MAG: hypothetical protein GY719_05865 [bacterium]|nr:hypothetical protein [bacterium]
MTPNQTEKPQHRHLSLADLAAYHERRLPEPKRDTIRDHLATCPRCADMLLDMSKLEETHAFRSDSRQEQSRLALRPILEKRVAPTLPTSAKKETRFGGTRRFRASMVLRLLPTAAALFFAFSYFQTAFELRKTVDELRRSEESQINPALLVLSPDGENRPGPYEPSPTLSLAPGERGWLQLNADGLTGFQEVQFRFIQLPEQFVVWQRNGIQARDSRSLRFEVSTAYVTSGEFRIELFGIPMGRPADDLVQIATYRLKIRTVPIQ